MKSPDRDAAEFGAALAWKQRFEAAQATASEYLEAIDQQASELATLRRRVAEMEEALTPFAAMHRDGSDPQEIACKRGYASDLTLISSGDFARASALLSPPTRKE